MYLDVLVEDNRWAEIDLEVMANAAIGATCSELGIDREIVEVSILACDDARIAVLNSEHRSKPTATNVLSWPTEELSTETPGAAPASPGADITGILSLGDLAISYDTCAVEAQTNGKSLQDHTTHLIVHGVLHLLGYDHENDADAGLMEGLERKILGKLGLDDPYKE
ncbi:MAG: rRNA maturation RNase YbeY [Pseudomonadota bacterium]